MSCQSSKIGGLNRTVENPHPEMIGVNWLSFYPWCVLAPARTLKAIEKIGFDCLQFSPTLRLGSVIRKPMQIPIPTVENAWYARKSAVNGLRPTLLDRCIFPRPASADYLFCQLTGRLQYTNGTYFRPWVIDHEFNNHRNLIEVSPGLGMTVQGIVETIKSRQLGCCLVLDLYHLRRKKATPRERLGRPGLGEDSLLGPWQESLPTLLPYTRLIHVSPNRETDELSNCLRNLGERNELSKMVETIANSRCPIEAWIIEATLGLRSFNWPYLVKAMSDLRAWLVYRLNLPKHLLRPAL